MAAGKNSISKTFVWILMGLLFVGLAGFGATSLTGTIRTVAQVGDESISVDAYVRELQREIRAVEAQTGQALQMSQARELGLEQLALSRLTSPARPAPPAKPEHDGADPASRHLPLASRPTDEHHRGLVFPRRAVIALRSPAKVAELVDAPD